MPKFKISIKSLNRDRNEYTQISYRLNVSVNTHTFRYREYHGRRVRRPLFDHDDRHFHRFPPHPDANVYEMNDVTSVHHASHAHVRDCDAYDARMNAVNAVDESDGDSAWDAGSGRIRNGFRRRSEDDTYCCTMAILLLSSAIELIADLNCNRTTRSVINSYSL